MRGPLAAALLAGLSLLSGCATVLDESLALASVPYHRTDDGRVVVPVYVNGSGPHSFAIDTAASRSVIFESLRDDIGLEHSSRDERA